MLQPRSSFARTRPFTSGIGSLRPPKAASILTLICAVGTAPGRAYASTMTQTKTATFAAGCFWGVDNYFNKHFKQGLIDSEVGYTGGEMDDPNYRMVCTGTTGHAEAVKFEYDPEKLDYADMVEYFYRIHDPTTPNRQGNDQGTQYRSAIFYHDEDQKRIAEEKTAELQKTRIKNKIVTDIVPASKWYSAEDYHQKYLIKEPGGYCNHRERW